MSFSVGLLQGSREMIELQNRLFQNYSVHVRPVAMENHVINMNVSMFIMNVMSLDLVAQTMKCSGFFDIVSIFNELSCIFHQKFKECIVIIVQ